MSAGARIRAAGRASRCELGGAAVEGDWGRRAGREACFPSRDVCMNCSRKQALRDRRTGPSRFLLGGGQTPASMVNFKIQ